MHFPPPTDFQTLFSDLISFVMEEPKKLPHPLPNQIPTEIITHLKNKLHTCGITYAQTHEHSLDWQTGLGLGIPFPSHKCGYHWTATLKLEDIQPLTIHALIVHGGGPPHGLQAIAITRGDTLLACGGHKFMMFSRVSRNHPLYLKIGDYLIEIAIHSSTSPKQPNPSTSLNIYKKQPSIS